MLKLENSQYQNSIFQLNYTRYEKNVMIQNFFQQKDLFNKMYLLYPIFHIIQKY